jgi:hypothetical protein
MILAVALFYGLGFSVPLTQLYDLEFGGSVLLFAFGSAAGVAFGLMIRRRAGSGSTL